MDPAIPNKNAPLYIKEAGKIGKQLGKFYPSLSNNCQFLPGLAVNISPHCIFFAGVFIIDMPTFNREVRDEVVRFYREHADLVHRLDGSMTYAHGFAPRIVEIDMIKEEVGEIGYEVMTKIKKAMDPNNIMNPYIRFNYQEDPVLESQIG